MSKAKETFQNGISLEQFIRKYDIRFKERYLACTINNKPYYGIFEGIIYQIKQIAKEGIFIPKYQEEDITTWWLFQPDYLHCFKVEEWKINDREFLLRRKWRREDLSNKELIEKGLNLGKEMWEYSIKNFDYYKEGNTKIKLPKTPKKTKKIAQRLIEYYNSVLFS